jgi:hypothetical protein
MTAKPNLAAGAVLTSHTTATSRTEPGKKAADNASSDSAAVGQP